MPATYDDRLQGITTSVAVKPSVRVATTAAITLSGLQTVDGVALADGNRVLVRGQASAVDNGIWVAHTNEWVRALDFNGSLDAVGGTLLYVIQGTLYGNTYWKVDGLGEKTVGADALTFSQSLLGDLASILYAPLNVSAQDAITMALRGGVADFRSIPDPAFAYLGILPRVEGPGVVHISRSVSDWFMETYAATIEPGTVYLRAGGSDSNNGSQPVASGGSNGPFATLPYTMYNATPSRVEIIGDDDPATPLILSGYDWSTIYANSGKVKILNVTGHVRIREPGNAASSLTFTLTTGSTYSAKLATDWAQNTAYAVNDLRWANNQVWRNISGGTSANTGTGPSGVTQAGINVVDGGTIWQLAPQVVSVLWKGRQIDGGSYPQTRQTSVANVQSANFSYCVVNGSVSIRIGTLDIDANKADIEIKYAFDAFDGVVNGVSYAQQRGTTTLIIVGPGSSLEFDGITPTASDRLSVRGGLFIDAGDASDRRCRVRYTGSYGIGTDNADCVFAGVDIYAAKADAFHYNGSSNILEAQGCRARKTGNILTWGQWQASLNGTSAHDTCNVARYGTIAFDNAGPNIADGGSGKIWNVACIASDSQEAGNKIGFYTTNTVEAWMDACHAHSNVNSDITADGNSEIHLFNTTYLIVAGSSNIDTYIPA